MQKSEFPIQDKAFLPKSYLISLKDIIKPRMTVKYRVPV